MPAHLKSLITQTNLTLSVKDKNLILGCWQGIFLLEHSIQKNKGSLISFVRRINGSFIFIYM